MSARETTPPELPTPDQPQPSPQPPVRRHSRVLTLVAAVAVLAMATAAVGLWRHRQDPADASPVVTAGQLTPEAASEELLTRSLLRSQSLALASHNRAGYLAGWQPTPTAQQRGALSYANLTKLGVSVIDASVDEGTVSGTGPTWTAAVDVTWALAGPDATPAHSALRYSFDQRGGRAVLVAIAPADAGRLPVWLLPALRVVRGDRTLVAATDPAAGARVSRLLQAAVKAVGAVLPRWHGGLLAYAPASERQFDALIAASPGEYDGIAAVTTTIDGSLDTSAPTVIVVNPQVFATLGTLGAHVVVTHEATHAATHAAAVQMPLWVAEGFADYVGIGSVHVPVSVAGRGALRVVRRDGPPGTLPSDAAFASTGSRLEATYEEAWLASRLIARTYGQARLVAFYRTVEAHPGDLAGAFVHVLHVSEPAFTRIWRSYLRGLAGAG